MLAILKEEFKDRNNIILYHFTVFATKVKTICSNTVTKQDFWVLETQMHITWSYIYGWSFS